MFPGINPKKMQAMMKQMGMAQEEIQANRVVIEKDEGCIIIDNPSIIKINMQGQTNFQISGDIKEQLDKTATQEDIKLVMEKTGCTEQQATDTLNSVNCDVTEAILSLSK